MGSKRRQIRKRLDRMSSARHEFDLVNASGPVRAGRIVTELLIATEIKPKAHNISQVTTKK